MFPIPATYRHRSDSPEFLVWILAFSADGTNATVVDADGLLECVGLTRLVVLPWTRDDDALRNFRPDARP